MNPILPLVLDATQVTCFRSCPRKFFLEFVYGVRPPGLSVHLHAGACIATALEETYRQIYLNKKPFEEAINIAHLRFLQEWGGFDLPSWKGIAKTMDRTWEAIVGDGTPEGRGYFQEYPVHSDHIKPFIAADGKPTLEYTFAIPLEPTGTHDDGRCFPLHPSGSPFLYGGRFDMLGQKPDGRPIPRDEKSTGAIGDSWSRQWALRGQFIGYTWACQQCGLDVTEVCVRGIGILVKSIKQVEHIQPYSNELIARWHEQLRRTCWNIRRSWDEGHWDFNFAEACTTFGNCIFMDSCTSHQPEMWLSDMEVRRWNPLEKNPVGVEDPSKQNAI